MSSTTSRTSPTCSTVSVQYWIKRVNARALSPPHLSVDGDALFCLATGSLARTDAPPVDALGLGAAECVAEAIVRAIRTATGLGGLPAWHDLFGAPRRSA